MIESKKKKVVILGMSGGVDSSVAALLLQKNGYKVIGMFMNCGVSKKKRWPTSIKWNDEEKEVKAICEKLNIELIVKDCGEGYERKVISKMFKDYSIGLTPNPDILCNNVGKFPLLYDIMKMRGADFIATGHYCRTKKTKDGKIELLTGKDQNKDQSYFLVGLPKKYISKCIFPIGDLLKDDVREIAKDNGFDNWNKRGSRGICYLGKIDMKDFLHSRIKGVKGDLVNEGGKIIGSHPGFEFFTIGEAVTVGKGILLNKMGRLKYSSEKLYVSKKKKGNVVEVVTKEGSKLYSKKIMIKGLKLVERNESVVDKKFMARIRHLGEFYNGVLKKINGRYIFLFEKKVRGVAPGQFIVLYKGKRVVGGGEMRIVRDFLK